jgi:magnesium-transporting ATPase (P-type)
VLDLDQIVPREPVYSAIEAGHVEGAARACTPFAGLSKPKLGTAFQMADSGLHYHALGIDELTADLAVNVTRGLGAAEAAERQQKFGPNRITAHRGTPPWLKFLQQFNQPLVYILLSAVAVTAVLGEWVDSGVIFGVVIVNALVGFLQEAKAEKAIAALAIHPVALARTIHGKSARWPWPTS